MIGNTIWLQLSVASSGLRAYVSGYLIALGNTEKSAKILKCVIHISQGSLVKELRTQARESAA